MNPTSPQPRAHRSISSGLIADGEEDGALRSQVVYGLGKQVRAFVFENRVITLFPPDI